MIQIQLIVKLVTPQQSEAIEIASLRGFDCRLDPDGGVVATLRTDTHKVSIKWNSERLTPIDYWSRSLDIAQHQIQNQKLGQSQWKWL